ncbi:MAG: motility protein A, partial [Syntrophomonadaceae bacterium]|nr:motility protein A [Syntrophomonadaceae bacterium]
SIQAGENPTIIREKLLVFLDPETRQTLLGKPEEE